MHIRGGVLAALVLSGLLGTPVLASTTAEYDISVNDAIDTPPKTVTIEGKTHTVSSLVAVQPGSSFKVEVTLPPDQRGRLYVYRNDDGATSTQTSELVTASSTTVTIATDGWQASSYVISLYANGTHHGVIPLVVEGYESTLKTPSTIESGATLSVTLSLSAGKHDPPPHSVEFVFANGSTYDRFAAGQESPTQYTGSLSLDTYAPGDYRLYAVVYSNETTRTGAQEVIAIGGPTAITITANTQPTTESPNSGGGGQSMQTTTPTDTTTTTSGAPPTGETTTTQLTTTTQPNLTTQVQSPTTVFSTTTATPSTPTLTQSNATTADSVIMPGGTITPPTSTTARTPVFPVNILAAGAALIVIIRLFSNRKL